MTHCPVRYFPARPLAIPRTLPGGKKSIFLEPGPRVLKERTSSTPQQAMMRFPSQPSGDQDEQSWTPNEVDGPRIRPEKPGMRITGSCASRWFGFIEIDADWNQISRGRSIQKESRAWSGFAIPARVSDWSQTRSDLRSSALFSLKPRSQSCFAARRKIGGGIPKAT